MDYRGRNLQRQTLEHLFVRSFVLEEMERAQEREREELQGGMDFAKGVGMACFADVAVIESRYKCRRSFSFSLCVYI